MRPFAAEAANLLLVHHAECDGVDRTRITGATYDRLRLLIAHNVAVYASHLPLDAHPKFGNNVLLRADTWTRAGRRIRPISYDRRRCSRECDRDTSSELFSRAAEFARMHGGVARSTEIRPGRRARRWGICTGAGASSETILEAQALELDTLIVGKGRTTLPCG
jgi:putative NIF3 family GTP cyclohydrolase 1 type 2